MALEKNFKITPKEEIKQASFSIVDVEEEAIFIVIDGWFIRVYFADGIKQADKEKYTKGKTVELEYTGDLENVHSLKMEKLSK